MLLSEDRSTATGQTTNADQFLVSKPQKVQRERKLVEGHQNNHLSIYPNMPAAGGLLSQNPLSPLSPTAGPKSPIPPPPPKAAAPPPPPPPGPPPPPSQMSPGVASASTLTSPKSAKTDSSADVDRGFLSDIKGNQV